MKGKRHQKILELIGQYDIETQEELTGMLQEAGFSVTQGTVSRDIRNLNIMKVTGKNGKQKYAVFEREDLHISNKYRRVLSEGILRIDPAGNILVIKTVPGMAMACAAAIDSISLNGIIGSIAGDDTIFCAIADQAMVDDVISDMNQIIHSES